MDATTYTTIGAMLAIGAALLNAVGYTVQKKGHIRVKEHNKKADASGGPKKRLVRDKVWAIGFSVYLIGGLLNAVALFFAPQSLVLPLSAITLVANTMLATKVLGEPFFKSDISGIVCVIIGSILAVWFGPRTAGGDSTMDELKLRWADPTYFLFFIILSAVVVADYLLVRYFERKNAQDHTVTDELKHGASWLLLSYCLLAGYFGSLAFLFLKSFTEFVGNIANDAANAENRENWYSYFTLIGVIVTNFLLEFFRQRGLSFFHAVYVVPINQCVLIVLGTVMGGLYFREFEKMSALDGALFCLAIVMTVMGVFILAFNSGNVSEKSELEIQETLSVGIEMDTERSVSLHPSLPRLPHLPSVHILKASPSMPLTRSLKADIPDLPPPGMTGTIARIHGLHKSMASMHFGKDGKPFYLNPDHDKISVFAVLDLHEKWKKQRLRRADSLPTTSRTKTYSGADVGSRSKTPPTQSEMELGRQTSRSMVVGSPGNRGTSSPPIQITVTDLETGIDSMVGGMERTKFRRTGSKSEESHTHGHHKNSLSADMIDEMVPSGRSTSRSSLSAKDKQMSV